MSFGPLGQPALVLALSLQITACGGLKLLEKHRTDIQQENISAYNAFKNPDAAPTSIKAAAEAVVKIVASYDGSSGSGSFVTADGLLMTNNHVMGAGQCASSGCYFDINIDFQIGKPYADAITVFGKPQFASVELDVTFLQLYSVDKSGKIGDKLPTPTYLQFAAASANELVGKHNYIVGHPHSALKKWSEGDVYLADGKWFRTTTFTLGGNSGSPVLDESGKIIGIIHRGPNRTESITSTGLETYSVCTSSQAILDAYQPGQGAKLDPVLFVNPTADQGIDETTVIANPAIFYQSHLASITTRDGKSKSIQQILIARCDQGIAAQSAATLEDFDSQLASCAAALAWINCKTKPTPSWQVCPADGDQTAWLARADQLATKVTAFNGEIPYTWLEFPGILLSSTTESRAAAEAKLMAFAGAHTTPLDFTLADHIIRYADPTGAITYNGVDLTDYIVHYDVKAHYEYFAPNILYAAAHLRAVEVLQRDTWRSIMQHLFNDPNISLPDHLTIERYAYGWRLM